MRHAFLATIAILSTASLGASPLAQTADPVAAFLALNASPDQRSDLRSMAKCTADRYPAAVQQVIRSQDAAQAITNNKNVLIDQGCAPQRFFRRTQFMITSLYYSQLAEFLLVSDYSSESTPNIKTVPPLDHPELSVIDPSKVPVQYRTQLIVEHWHHKLDLVADCVGRAAPENAFALARSKPNSVEEKGEWANLQSTLVGCKANELKPSPSAYALRAAISENLYRLFDAAQPVNHS